MNFCLEHASVLKEIRVLRAENHNNNQLRKRHTQNGVRDLINLAGNTQHGVRDLTIAYFWIFNQQLLFQQLLKTEDFKSHTKTSNSRAHMVSFVCAHSELELTSVSLVRCAHTPRPNLFAAIADGLPILLVDRPRRQLSRPPHDDRRRGARCIRPTLSSFCSSQSVRALLILRICPFAAACPPARGHPSLRSAIIVVD